jgi:FMNH2-dependent dimethyl sulfone monooxygenase
VRARAAGGQPAARRLGPACGLTGGVTEVMEGEVAMGDTDDRAEGAARHPVYSERKLRLGTFSSNLSHGCAISTIEGLLEARWSSTLALARMADQMAFEALVPVGRWRGFGGVSNFNGAGFECFTWAAGVGAATSRAGIFATSHVPTIHPIMAAKQAATVDHITGGRFALNVVTGWHTPEIEMFGAPQLPHADRYAMAVEWLTIVKRLWTEDEPFDHEGRFFKVTGAELMPKPLQRPHPVVMNAGGSETGRHFAAKYCDVAFVIPDAHDFDSLKARSDHYRRLAREEYGRELQVWTYCYAVQADTEEGARRYFDHYVHEKGDWQAVDNLVTTMGMTAQTLPPAVLRELKVHFIGGWGGMPLVGTADQVVEGLGMLVRAGFDGVLLSWPRYVEDCARFQAETYPMLVQAGLRG